MFAGAQAGSRPCSGYSSADSEHANKRAKPQDRKRRGAASRINASSESQSGARRSHPHSVHGTCTTNGCLVVATTNTMQSTQDSPGKLAWSTEPDYCTSTPPSNSVFLDWNYLNSKSGQTCASWGEPAIMVSSDGTIYLAPACFSPTFLGTGYWIFSAPTPSVPTWMRQISWS